MRKCLVLAAIAMPLAAQGEPSATALGQVPPGLYAVEPDHTDAAFTLDFFGLFTSSGVFSGASGELRVDMQHPATMALSVSLPVASVHTPNPRLGQQLRSKLWLDAAAFPDMRFTSTSITLIAPNLALVSGKLTLHGVTRPLTLTARFHGAGLDPVSHRYVVGFDAVGHLRRSDFGVRAWLPVVGNKVRLTLDAAFERQ